MREAMLAVHFIGLSMGIGSGFAFMFLGIAGSKMEKGEGLKFMLNTSTISKMGQLGLLLLIISGGYLMTPYWENLASTPLLIAKLLLVVVLITIVIINSAKVNQAKKGNAEVHMKNVPTLGRIALLSGITIVVLAVLVFK